MGLFYQTLDGKEDELKEEYLVPSLDDLGFDRRKLGAILYPWEKLKLLIGWSAISRKWYV